MAESEAIKENAKKVVADAGLEAMRLKLGFANVRDCPAAATRTCPVG